VVAPAAADLPPANGLASLRLALFGDHLFPDSYSDLESRSNCSVSVLGREFSEGMLYSLAGGLTGGTANGRRRKNTSDATEE